MSITSDTIVQATHDVLAIQSEHEGHQALLRRLGVTDPDQVIVVLLETTHAITMQLPDESDQGIVDSFLVSAGFAIGLQAARRARELGEE